MQKKAKGRKYRCKRILKRKKETHYRKDKVTTYKTKI